MFKARFSLATQAGTRASTSAMIKFFPFPCACVFFDLSVADLQVSLPSFHAFFELMGAVCGGHIIQLELTSG